MQAMEGLSCCPVGSHAVSICCWLNPGQPLYTAYAMAISTYHKHSAHFCHGKYPPLFTGSSTNSTDMASFRYISMCGQLVQYVHTAAVQLGQSDDCPAPSSDLH